MSLNIEIDVNDDATPVLLTLVEALTDRTAFHGYLSLDVAEHTRRHIRSAAQSRHKTALRLGSAPTGYLSKAANTVESDHDSDGITLRVAGAIFKRVGGPVTIRPRAGKKYLTIPVHAEAVGRAARELWWPAKARTSTRKTKRRPKLIQGLVLITSKKGNLLLVKPNGDGTITPYYVLKSSVTLPQDEGLLPTSQELGAVAEKTATWYLRKRVRELGT
jgi:hypothetical protein